MYFTFDSFSFGGRMGGGGRGEGLALGMGTGVSGSWELVSLPNPLIFRFYL